MRFLFLLAYVSLLLAAPALAQDVTSGPEKGAKVPGLKVNTRASSMSPR